MYVHKLARVRVVCVFLTRVYCVVAFSWLLKISPAYEHLGICWPRVALAATSLNLGRDVIGPGSQLPELPQLPPPLPVLGVLEPLPSSPCCIWYV